MKKTGKNKSVLSLREIQVLKLVFAEKSKEQIATKLGVTIHTVRFHKLNLYRKTKSKSIIGLIKYAIKRKLVKVP
jgi:DNA-binding CsgD family transcriptional regulator